MRSLNASIQHLMLWASALFLAASLGLMIAFLSPSESFIFVGLLIVMVLATTLLIRFGLLVLANVTLGLMVLSLAWTAIRPTSFMALSDAFLFVTAVLVLPSILTSSGMARFGQALPTILPGLVITLGGLLSSAFASNPSASLSNLFRFALASLLVPLIIWLTISNHTAIARAAWLWMASVGISVIYATFLEITPFGRVRGLTQHPNHLALTCVLAFGPALSKALSSSGIRQGCWTALSGIFVYGVYLSGSRSGAVGIAAVILLVVLLKRSLKLIMIGTGIVLLMLVAILGGWVDLDSEGDLARLVDLNSAQVASSNIERRERLNEQLAEIRDNPLIGVGFENALDGHNLVLQLWGASGIAGVIGLVLLVRAGIVQPMRVLWRDSMREKSILLGLVAGFGGFLIADIFQNALWERYFWLFPALVAGAMSREANPATTSAGPLVEASKSTATQSRSPVDAPKTQSAEKSLGSTST